MASIPTVLLCFLVRARKYWLVSLSVSVALVGLVLLRDSYMFVLRSGPRGYHPYTNLESQLGVRDPSSLRLLEQGAGLAACTVAALILAYFLGRPRGA